MVAADAPDRARRTDTLLEEHARDLLLVAALLGAAVLVSWLLAKTTGLIGPAGDAYRLHRVHQFHGPVRDTALGFVALGDPLSAALTVALLAAWSYRRDGPRAALLPFAAMGVVVATTIAKQLPGRVTTLPSGHTAYAIAIGGYAAWLLASAGRPRVAVAVLAFAALMAPARVIEGAHEPADVIAGAALGLAWLTVVLVFGRRWVRGTLVTPG